MADVTNVVKLRTAFEPPKIPNAVDDTVDVSAVPVPTMPIGANGAKKLGAVDPSLLAEGAKGDLVRDLQKNLTAWGFSPGNIDGVYGPQTAGAVRSLQSMLNVRVDGIVGPETVAAINDDLVKGSASKLLSRQTASAIVLAPQPAAAIAPAAALNIPQWLQFTLVGLLGAAVVWLILRPSGEEQFAEWDEDEEEDESEPAALGDSTPPPTAGRKAIEEIKARPPKGA